MDSGAQHIICYGKEDYNNNNCCSAVLAPAVSSSVIAAAAAAAASYHANMISKIFILINGYIKGCKMIS